jgi:hypothetical protein
VSTLTAPNCTVTTYERDLDGAVLAQRTVREADGATVLLLERSFDSRGRTQFEGASWSDDTLSGMVGSADVLQVDGVGGHVQNASVRGIASPEGSGAGAGIRKTEGHSRGRDR